MQVPSNRVGFIVVGLAAAATLAACSEGSGSATPPSSEQKVELVVYAATSTRDALQALEVDYERDHPVDLVFNFGSSGDLSRQIVAAGKADVFLSADEREMDRLAESALLLAGTRKTLLSNQLVVIEPADAPTIFADPFTPAQLALPAVKLLSLGDVETVSAGRYAKAWLERNQAWDSVANRVLPGIDVRAALAAVESGGAQAGIVYRTDVARTKKARIVHAVPLADGLRIEYPIAVIAGGEHTEAARAFVEYAASPSARPAFERFGFVFLSTLPDSK